MSNKCICVSDCTCFAVLCRFSCVQLCVNIRTAALQAPLSMGFSRQEYWSGLPWPPSGNLPNPENEPVSHVEPALEGRLFTPRATWDVLDFTY